MDFFVCLVVGFCRLVCYFANNKIHMGNGEKAEKEHIS